MRKFEHVCKVQTLGIVLYYVTCTLTHALSISLSRMRALSLFQTNNGNYRPVSACWHTHTFSLSLSIPPPSSPSPLSTPLSHIFFFRHVAAMACPRSHADISLGPLVTQVLVIEVLRIYIYIYICMYFCIYKDIRTGFAWDSGYERTFSKLPKVKQVKWKLPKQKNFSILIIVSFNQNRISLRSNISGGFGHKYRRLPPSRWRYRRKYYWVILVPGIFSATFFYDPTTS